MLTDYRFSINGTVIYPHYNNDTSKEISLQNNEMFSREKLSSIKLSKRVFDFINNSALDTIFHLLVERYVSGSWTNYSYSKFMKTDCKFDYDDKIIEVSLSYDDIYEEIITKIKNTI